MREPRVGSLFSGIGGLDLGLQRAGFAHAFLCENNPYRRDLLATRWPRVPVFEDVRTFPAAGHVDVLCGGFPCQDLSVAGKRAGLGGPRSSLFFQFARCADALVGDGDWILVENVPGLLSSHGGRDFAVVLATLAELGFYDCAWRVLDSRHFGVPQRRRRVFVVARRARGRRACQVLLEPESGGGDFEASIAAWPNDPAASLSGLGTGGPDDNDGQAGRVIAVAIAENQRAEVLETDYAHQLSSGGGKPGQGYSAARTAQGVRRLTPMECERLQSLPDGWTDLGDTPDAPRYAALGDAVTANVSEWIGRRLYAAIREDR